MIKSNKPIQVSNPILPTIEKYALILTEVWENEVLSNFAPKHNALEERLKAYLDATNISIFSNGMLALMAAFQLLKIKGEVITTPFTYMATPHALSLNGLTPVFCDVRSDTLCIDADTIEEKITDNTSAILGVHIFGNPCDDIKISELAKKYGLKVVYDAAHAFGTEFNGSPICNWGDITMLSFHFTKLFHTAEGGALCYNENSFAEEMVKLRRFGHGSCDHPEFPGFNGKMTELQAALGLLVLDMVQEEVKMRAKVQQRYIDNLSGIEGLSFVLPSSNVKPSFQYMIMRIDEELFGLSREIVLNSLHTHNIMARSAFPLCSEFSYYKAVDSATMFPNAYKASRECIMLPFWGNMSVDLIDSISEIIINSRN